MKALVYLGTEKVAYQDVADAKPISADDVLVDIAFSGICGSDMHAFLGHDERRPAPLILGHEASGTVRMPEGAHPWHGKRVAINPLVSCHHCEFCDSGRENLCQSRQIISMPPREGAFAEQIYMPIGNLLEVPENVPLWHAALTEPLACGWHAVRLALEATKTDSVEGLSCLVLGGGAIGVGSALALMAQGVKHRVSVIEPNGARRSRLVKNLPEFLWLNEAPKGGNQFDIVIDAVGYAMTRSTASAVVKPGGVIAHIGLGHGEGGLDIRRMTLQEISFIGTYTYTAKDFVETGNAIFGGKLGDFKWVDHRPMTEGSQAFSDMHAGCVEGAKLMLVV